MPGCNKSEILWNSNDNNGIGNIDDNYSDMLIIPVITIVIFSFINITCKICNLCCKIIGKVKI